MASKLVHGVRASPRSFITQCCAKLSHRNQRNATTTFVSKDSEGDISNVFSSLSGMSYEPLEPRFAQVKRKLIAGHEDAVIDSWRRLLDSLREEIPIIANLKSKVIPEIDFQDLDHADETFKSEHRKRGVAVIRNVIPQQEALDLKEGLKRYISANPHTKAFPADNPQVFELYWSRAQIKARAHPNLLKAQKFLMEFWQSRDPDAAVSSSHPIIYADRLRMRLPGDAQFALGPHVDGGSCERWEEAGYGRGKVYDSIWKGKWEEYDPWESSARLPVVSDLYGALGACSVFRMFQGWMSLSRTGPYEGTLLVNPLLSRATAYFLLRPFFSPKRPAVDAPCDSFDEAFLSPDNWELDLSSSNSWLQGASHGRGQELRPQLHPHLDLPSTMVHIPRVNPGDYVSWHCDTIHAVDNIHAGTSDSSVLYIPACPLTEESAEFMARQRACFLEGVPSPDFGAGKGESEHIGRAGLKDVRKVSSVDGLQAFGLHGWDDDAVGLKSGQRKLLKRANTILGFHN